MRRIGKHGSEQGQSMVEFLFIILFFIMLVGFLRTFVYFELDVFNNTNLARWKTLKYVRDTVDSKSFGKQDEKEYKKFSDQTFQKITSLPLRPIPFLIPSSSSLRQKKMPERKLTWAAGTKFNAIGIPFNNPAAILVAIATLGFTV